MRKVLITGGAGFIGSTLADRLSEEGIEVVIYDNLSRGRLDFIAAENSMGFHAPQEATMVLGEALDYARQGELAAARWRSPVKTAKQAAKP